MFKQSDAPFKSGKRFYASLRPDIPSRLQPHMPAYPGAGAHGAGGRNTVPPPKDLELKPLTPHALGVPERAAPFPGYLSLNPSKQPGSTYGQREQPRPNWAKPTTWTTGSRPS